MTADPNAEAAIGRTAERAPTALRRWPTAAGLVFGGAIAGAFAIGRAGELEMAQVLTAAAFVYLGAAALGRRGAAWPLFGVTFVLITIGAIVPGFDPLWAIAAMGTALVVWGLVRGRARPAWGLPLTAGAMVVAGAIAIAVALLGQPWAGLLVGLGLLGHAAWDAFHLRADRVVGRSLAEFCLVLDTVIGLAVIVLSLL